MFSFYFFEFYSILFKKKVCLLINNLRRKKIKKLSKFMFRNFCFLTNKEIPFLNSIYINYKVGIRKIKFSI